jgi:hypothetical protein
VPSAAKRAIVTRAEYKLARMNEQRKKPDRREKPTGPWGAFPPAGNRMKARREFEHQRPYFIDRFSAVLLASVLLLLLASLADAAITIQLLEAGGSEINPLMSLLLRRGPSAFLTGKYLLTVAGLPLLLIFKNYYLFGTRFRVGYLIPFFVLLYVVLIAYQACLIREHILTF